MTTFWCNNNRISNLSAFLDEVSGRFPNLQYMSLMRNPVSSFDSETSETDGSAAVKGPVKYRLAVLTKLPTLKMLDSVVVTAEEVASAKQLATDLFNEDAG